MQSDRMQGASPPLNSGASLALRKPLLGHEGASPGPHEPLLTPRGFGWPQRCVNDVSSSLCGLPRLPHRPLLFILPRGIRRRGHRAPRCASTSRIAQAYELKSWMQNTIMGAKWASASGRSASGRSASGFYGLRHNIYWAAPCIGLISMRG